MQYFGVNKNFERIKVNFTGINNGNRSSKYFDLYSLTKERLTVRLGSMKNLTFLEDPYMPALGIYDLETNVQLGHLDQTFSIVDPLLITNVIPTAQFSLVDQINVTLRLRTPANLTHCIQVIDKKGQEIITPALKINSFEY